MVLQNLMLFSSIAISLCKVAGQWEWSARSRARPVLPTHRLGEVCAVAKYNPNGMNIS